ncbi:MAG: FAD-dependent oxidoreductase, partial [Betaproteobacteria bacterium]
DAPLLFRFRWSLNQWSWGLRFLYECLPSRTRRNTLRILELALYSHAELLALRDSANITYDHSELGILHLHSDAKSLDAAGARVELMRSHGFTMSLKNAEQCLELEPALRLSRVRIVGGTYAPSDESGDAHMFSRKLEELCQSAGVTLHFQTTVQRVVRESGRISGVHVRHVEGPEEVLTADAYVACLGSYTPLLLRPVGVHLPVYPVKGYSVTLPVEHHKHAPRMCLSDESAKLAISRLGGRLRIAGTAELDGYDDSMHPFRCISLLTRAEDLFPDGANFGRAQFWTGLRPCTPSNVPLIGRTHLPNLFLNTGHGTLGWTLACGSARIVADVIAKRRPEVDLESRSA